MKPDGRKDFVLSKETIHELFRMPSGELEELGELLWKASQVVEEAVEAVGAAEEGHSLSMLEKRLGNELSALFDRRRKPAFISVRIGRPSRKTQPTKL